MTIPEILVTPSNYLVPWMSYIAISGSDVVPVGDVLADELHRKLGTVRVVRNTYHISATFGQDEPTADDQVIKSVAIFSAAVGGTLGEYWILANDDGLVKDNIDEIVIECAVTFLHEEA